MANLDKPAGFHPAQSSMGFPWTGLVRSIGANDSTDIFMFDHLTTASGLGAAATADTDIVLGVAVGFGKNLTVAGTMGGSRLGMAFDPSNLETGTRYYDDSASTNTEWNVFYVPAAGMLFEAQDDASGTAALLIGTSYDITYGSGNTTTGISGYEIAGGTTAGDNEGVMIIKHVTDPENNFYSATANATDNARYLVRFNRTGPDDLA